MYHVFIFVKKDYGLLFFDKLDDIIEKKSVESAELEISSFPWHHGRHLIVVMRHLEKKSRWKSRVSLHPKRSITTKKMACCYATGSTILKRWEFRSVWPSFWSCVFSQGSKSRVNGSTKKTSKSKKMRYQPFVVNEKFRKCGQSNVRRPHFVSCSSWWYRTGSVFK